MNRCTLRLITAAILLAASVCLPSLTAIAQSSEFKAPVRTFPKAALRGEMVVLAPPVISIDGKRDRLSVGSRIHDANNHLVLSAALVNQSLPVNYLRENGGPVHEVWILNSEEASQKRPGAASTLFNFSSGTPATQ